MWLFIMVATIAVILGGLWAWSESRYIEVQSLNKQARSMLMDMDDQLVAYSDAVDECQESRLLWATAVDTKNDVIGAFVDGLSTFSSSWNYRAGDGSVIYEGAKRLQAQEQRDVSNAAAAVCQHP